MSTSPAAPLEPAGDEQMKPGPDGLRVIVDRTVCIGSGDCVTAAPTVFRLDATQRVTLLEPLSVDAKTIRRAAERCPTDAVILETADGEQVYP